MEFLLSHWHCILPVVAIIIGFFVMNRDKSKKKNGRNREDAGNNGGDIDLE